MCAGESHAWLQGQHGGLGEGLEVVPQLQQTLMSILGGRFSDPGACRKWQHLQNAWGWEGEGCLKLPTPRPWPSFPVAYKGHNPRDCTLLGSSALVFSITTQNVELQGKLCVLAVVGGNRRDASCCGKAEDRMPPTLIQGGIMLLPVVCGTDGRTEVGEERGHLIPLSVESQLFLASKIKTLYSRRNFQATGDDDLTWQDDRADGDEVFPVMELTSPSEAGRVFGTKTKMDFILNYNIFISL